jgi:hypothetical protein
MGVGGFSSGETALLPNNPSEPPNAALTAPSPAPRNDNAEQSEKRQKTDAARKPKTSPKAKIAADILESFQRLESVAGNDPLYAFTLRIHAPLLEGRENPTTWMQHRIARELKNRLVRDVPFVAVFEWRTNGAPGFHIHGAMPLPAHEKQRASDALRAAGGRWRDRQGRARQVDIRPIDPQASFKGASGLAGWALYCADDSRQTQLELNRRREALDPQQQHHRAPNIILKSGLNVVSDVTNSKWPPAVRDVTKISDVMNSIEDHMGRHKEEPTQRFTVRIKETDLAELDGWIARQGDEDLNRQGGILRLVRDGIRDVDNSAAINDVMNLPSALDPTDREELECLRLEAPAIQARLAELEAYVRSMFLELETENGELKRQLAARTDTRAQPSLIDNLSPADRAEFDRLHPSLAGETGAEKLAALIEKALRVTASGYAARQAKQVEVPTVTTAPTPVMVPDPAPSHDHSPSRDELADLDGPLAPLADPTLQKARCPEIESEEDFLARMKAIRDDANKMPAQIQREQKAEQEAREAKRRDRDRASKSKLTPAEIDEILAPLNELAEFSLC